MEKALTAYRIALSKMGEGVSQAAQPLEKDFNKDAEAKMLIELKTAKDIQV